MLLAYGTVGAVTSPLLGHVTSADVTRSRDLGRAGAPRLRDGGRRRVQRRSAADAGLVDCWPGARFTKHLTKNARIFLGAIHMQNRKIIKEVFVN